MYIHYDDRFIDKYLTVYDFIYQDSKNHADDFEKKLKEAIINTTHFPYKHRKSIYFDNEDIRDLIFKGYSIPFKIDKENNMIIVLSIVKYHENA